MRSLADLFGVPRRRLDTIGNDMLLFIVCYFLLIVVLSVTLYNVTFRAYFVTVLAGLQNTMIFGSP